MGATFGSGSTSFAEIYNMLLHDIQSFTVHMSCNGNDMLYEMMNVTLNIKIKKDGDIPLISIYSCKDTKAIPIGFTLAEFLTILTKDPDISYLVRFNKNIINYTEYGTSSFHYGTRLYYQLPNVLEQLKNDKHTRQACANIWFSTDLTNKHKSCNVFLQFIIRNNMLDLVVISRSSDLLTGLLIDAFHWQALLIAFYWDLKSTYNDLDIGSVVYKITSLHVYEKDQFIFKNMPNLLYQPEYVHYLPFTKAFSQLNKYAIDVKYCQNVNELCDVYIFNEHQIDIIHSLQDVFKNRKYNIAR